MSATGVLTFVRHSLMLDARLAGGLLHDETWSAIDDTLARTDLDAEWLNDRPRASVDDEDDLDEEEFDDEFEDDDLDDELEDDEDFDEDDEDFFDDDVDEGEELED